MLPASGGSIVASRRSVPSVKIAGLERAARFAGESFGHEDVASLSASRFAETPQSRRLYWLVAGAVLLGLSLRMLP